MTDHYRIIGAELSPFSVKVRSYFRFKTIPHQWIARSLAVQEEYAAYFKIPVTPLAGQRWTRKPQKYHVKSLEALRKKYAELEDKQEVEGLLRELDCLDPLLR